MRLTWLYVPLAIGIIIVFYFSWVPSPRLSLYGNLPDWVTRWTDTDENMNLRTAVPFVFMGLASGAWLFIMNRSRLEWMAAWLVLIGVVIIAEAGQLFLPNRYFDLGDIAWGSVGSLIGMVVSLTLLFVAKKVGSLVKS